MRWRFRFLRKFERLGLLGEGELGWVQIVYSDEMSD
jgi:hypothetical protein